MNLIPVNEFNTSKLYNKSLKEMENVNVKRNKHKKSLYEILTLKKETKCRIFVNRDTNNYKIIFYTFIHLKRRFTFILR
jgi:hypothetical protein